MEQAADLCVLCFFSPLYFTIMNHAVVQGFQWVFQEVFKESKEFPVNSRRFLQWIQGNFKEFKEISRNSRRLQGIQRDFKEFKDFLKYLRKFQRIQGDFKEFKEFSRNLRRFQGIQEFSRNSRSIQETQGVFKQFNKFLSSSRSSTKYVDVFPYLLVSLDHLQQVRDSDAALDSSVLLGQTVK